MNSTSQSAFLSAILLWVSMAGNSPVWAQENNATATAPPVSTREDELAFRQAIATIESSQGAYATGLSEQLLSLGLVLQAQGRHDEAVGLFKRGVHLARINDGLYSSEQIPLLQGQIASHIVLGGYTEADERQHYLYRVQLRNMGSGEPQSTAFMQQANWQYNAYRLGLGAQGYTRIMNMWDLYRLALNDIIMHEGETSPKLLPPLHGMLQAQYLISSYQWEDHDHNSGDDMGSRQNLNRFNAYRAQSYQKGSSVITAIHDIERDRGGGPGVATAKTLIMLGDWQLWHGDREEAWQTYRDAGMELAARDDAQVLIDQLLGEPVALPDIAGLRPLPPVVDAEQADILLEFGVTTRGRVVNLKRMDENDANEDKEIWGHRLMRTLRKTRFRPRIEAGQPIEAEKIVKAFNIK